jgi:3-oxoacyl-[acyl-carrier protein] reductase
MGERVVLVSGASGGIGTAVCRQLAEDSTVVMLGRDAQRLERARGRIGGGADQARLVPLPADINSPQSVESATAAVTQRYGRIDALVHCAGDGPMAPLLETTEEMWQTTINAKLLGAVRLCRSVGRVMAAQGGGSVVLLGGTFRKQPDPDFPVNAAVNAALAAFAKAVSRDLGRSGVRVNVVDPGVTDTALWNATAEDIARRGGVRPQDVNAQIVAGTPTGRLTRPQDVADLVRFLLSPAAQQLTGAAIPLDGGFAAAL